MRPRARMERVREVAQTVSTSRAFNPDVQADDIPIPSPCHEDWNAMQVEDRKRFCQRCREHVHDLSAMTQAEALALLESRSDLCVSYEIDPDDDTVRFAPPVRAPLVPFDRLRRSASTLAPVGLAVALTACAPHGDRDALQVDPQSENQAPEARPIIPLGAAPRSPVELSATHEAPTSNPAQVQAEQSELGTGKPRRLRGRVAPRKRMGKPIAPRQSPE